MKANITPKNVYLFLKHHFTEQPFDHPKQDRDMNIVDLGLDLEEYYSKLQEFKNTFAIQQIQTINYKSDNFPIYELEINKGAEIKVFVLSGTHGNEQAGLFATLELLQLFKNDPTNYEKFNIKILTPNNPVSIKYFSRFNGDGIDINRDFKKQRTLETKAVIKLIEDFRPDFAITLHEALHEDGVFIYGNKLVEEEFAVSVLNKVQENGVKLAKKGYFPGKFKIPGYKPLKGVIFFWIKLWSDLLDLQPFGYFTVLEGIPNITIESSWQSESKDKRVNAHVEIVKAVLEELKKLQT